MTVKKFSVAVPRGLFFPNISLGAGFFLRNGPPCREALLQDLNRRLASSLTRNLGTPDQCSLCHPPSVQPIHMHTAHISQGHVPTKQVRTFKRSHLFRAKRPMGESYQERWVGACRPPPATNFLLVQHSFPHAPIPSPATPRARLPPDRCRRWRRHKSVATSGIPSLAHHFPFL